MRRVQLLALAMAGAACLAAAPAFDWKLPAGVAPPPVPADNPMSKAKVELGRRLFYDADLSVDGTMACSTCHEQHRGFADATVTHAGVKGQAGKRNVMGLTNIGYVSPLTWADPTTKTLEAQMPTPVFGEHPVEMGMFGKEAELIRRISADACYRRQFAEAFPETKGEITVPAMARAVAAFERTLLSFNSPYDRSLKGHSELLSPAAWRGVSLFEIKGCHTCHRGVNFSDNSFHDIGLPALDRDPGVAEKTGNARDRNLFRTTTLRNVALTGPFMHDGSVKTLTGAVLAHTKIMGGAPGPAISAEEAKDLAAFMEALTDKSFIEDERFSLPKKLCGKKR